jgi:hypothetical protein
MRLLLYPVSGLIWVKWQFADGAPARTGLPGIGLFSDYINTQFFIWDNRTTGKGGALVTDPLHRLCSIT